MADKAAFSVDLRELLEAGCHFGHQARRWNPKMDQYIYTQRDGVHIFDLAITANQLAEAMEYVRDLVAEGKEIIFVGTKRQAQEIVKEEAIKAGAPFVAVRWLGGLLTNWEQMQDRIKHLNDLKDKKEKGEFDRYTKKEQILIDREIARLERFFGGIAHLKRRPEALFIVDTHREDTAVREAGQVGIPVIGMVDSNANPEPVAKVIPVNDDAVRSIKLVVSSIAKAYAEGKNLKQKNTPKPAPAATPVQPNQAVK
jgi:small subunit ribosomal protein S2